MSVGARDTWSAGMSSESKLARTETAGGRLSKNSNGCGSNGCSSSTKCCSIVFETSCARSKTQNRNRFQRLNTGRQVSAESLGPDLQRVVRPEVEVRADLLQHPLRDPPLRSEVVLRVVPAPLLLLLLLLLCRQRRWKVAESGGMHPPHCRCHCCCRSTTLWSSRPAPRRPQQAAAHVRCCCACLAWLLANLCSARPRRSAAVCRRWRGGVLHHSDTSIPATAALQVDATCDARYASSLKQRYVR